MLQWSTVAPWTHPVMEGLTSPQQPSSQWPSIPVILASIWLGNPNAPALPLVTGHPHPQFAMVSQ